jgi:protein associated with RNAse G/E
MAKGEKKDDSDNFINDYNQELDEALKTPESARKYFDELDDFIANISEEELSGSIDTMLYNMVKKMLNWSEEQIESVLTNVSISIINEYLKCIQKNVELQEGNSSRINILKDLVKNKE